MSGDTFEALQVYATYGCWPSCWKIGVWSWDSELKENTNSVLKEVDIILPYTAVVIAAVWPRWNCTVNMFVMISVQPIALLTVRNPRIVESKLVPVCKKIFTSKMYFLQQELQLISFLWCQQCCIHLNGVKTTVRINQTLNLSIKWYILKMTSM